MASSRSTARGGSRENELSFRGKFVSQICTGCIGPPWRHPHVEMHVLSTAFSAGKSEEIKEFKKIRKLLVHVACQKSSINCKVQYLVLTYFFQINTLSVSVNLPP